MALLGAGFWLEPKAVNIFTGDDVRLELAEVSVSNPQPDYTSVSAGELSQKPATEPTIAATVRNRGHDTAWVNEARITILDGARFGVCYSQGGGDVPHSKPYRVTMPEFPGTERRVIRRDLHVEVQPGHGVRPLLRFQKDDFGATGLYAIDVRYAVDPGDRVLDAGRFVIGVPGPVERAGVVLPEDESELTAEWFPADDLMVTWCLRHNIAAAREMVAQPGRRSADVAALAHLRLAPSWPELANHDPLREAVDELLRSDAGDAPLYAFDAARLTGDAKYEEEVQDRVTDTLLARSAEELDEWPLGAALDAERALSLNRTERAGRLLAQARAARVAEDERIAKEERAESVTRLDP